MAPLRAKKQSKTRDARLSMRAAPPSDKFTDSTPSLTPAGTADFTDSSDLKSYSYSVPGSPVSKLTPSLQPSPTLSTSSGILRSDINPFLLPPLAYHDNAKNPFLTGVEFEDISQPRVSAKLKKRERRNKISKSPAAAAGKPEVPQEEREQSQTEQAQNASKDRRAELNTRRVESTPAETSEILPSTSPAPTSSNDQQTQENYPALPNAGKSEGAPKKQPTKSEAASTPDKCDTVSEARPPLQPYPQQPGYHQFSGHHGQQYQRSFAVMSHPNGYPPGYSYSGAPPARVGSPYQMPYSNYTGPYPYRHGSPRPRHDSFGSKGSNRDEPNPASAPPPGDIGSAIEDDPGDLVSRIASVIPDIHMLLSRSKETHGELSLRDQLLRRTEAQSAEAVKQKEEHVNQLMRQLQNTEKHHASESNKHRLQIGNLEDKQKELEERLLSAELSKQATEDLKQDLEGQKAILLKERMTLAKVAAEEKDRMIRDFEDWKMKARESLDAEKQKSMEAINQKQEAIIQKQEIEGSFDKMRKDFEGKLSKTQEHLEAAIKTERENREQWITEREALTKGWEEEQVNLKKDADEQLQALVKQHEEDIASRVSKNGEEMAALVSKNEEEVAALVSKYKEETHDLLMSFAKIQEGLNRENTIEIDSLKQELTKQKEAWDNEREELRSMVAGVKVATEGLEAEKGRLQKLVESFGEVTDIKSKGDAYYLDAFSQLSKQIFALAATQFNHLPVFPPPKIIAQIPASLPSILDDTPSSRYLRAAYIAHTISSIIANRVFTPFLFSIGRRFDQADALFTNMGKFLRSKSTRKEAIWRQQTLYAAYKTTDAKERFNTAAASVIEEIINAISPFADRTAEDAIIIAVRKIVKLAVESWRFARLEREMIEAKMPSHEEITEEDGNAAFWVRQNVEQPADTPNVNQKPNEDRKILLRLFPIICREPIHEGFRLTEKEINDHGTIYSHGLALYDDPPQPLKGLRIYKG